jgi:hypothetical protein
LTLPGKGTTLTQDCGGQYARRCDTGIPEHRVKWNWLLDLPVGSGKLAEPISAQRLAVGLDASLFKNIPIHERVNLRFKADFFNVLNHPGNPNSVGGDGFLKTQNSGQSPRVLQLSLRLSW